LPTTLCEPWVRGYISYALSTNQVRDTPSACFTDVHIWHTSLEGTFVNPLYSSATNDRARTLLYGDVIAGNGDRPTIDATLTSYLSITWSVMPVFQAHGSTVGA
jgi:hypothetical protein